MSTLSWLGSSSRSDCGISLSAPGGLDRGEARAVTLHDGLLINTERRREKRLILKVEFLYVNYSYTLLKSQSHIKNKMSGKESLLRKT